MMETRRLLVLILLMLLYLCMGAAIFNALEGQNEKVRLADLKTDIHNFLDNHSCVSRGELTKLLFTASRDGELVYYILHNKTHLDRWDFSGAFGFSISLVTTIGFGNLAPHTMEGKILVVVYALVGIPLMLLLLAGIGEKLVLLFKRINQLQLCSSKPQVNRTMNTVLIIVLGVLVGFILPATLFTFIEDWHFLESLYFCFTTLSTVGFGDYIIGIHEQKISEGAWHETYEVVAYIWILFGLAYVSLVIKYLSDLFISKAHKMEQHTVRRLEQGTRLFRKVSNAKDTVTQDGESPSTNSKRLSDSGDQPDYVAHSPGDSPPPTYSADLQRENPDSICHNPTGVGSASNGHQVLTPDNRSPNITSSINRSPIIIESVTSSPHVVTRSISHSPVVECADGCPANGVIRQASNLSLRSSGDRVQSANSEVELLSVNYM